MITDDPGTPAQGEWEVNVSFTSDLHPDEKEYESPLMDINYGWNDRTQLKVEFPFLITSSGNEDIHHEFGDVSVGLKYRFFDEEQTGFALATFPQIELASGNHPEYEVLLPLELETSRGPLVLGADLRLVTAAKQSPGYQNGLLVGMTVSDRLALMGEITHGAQGSLFRVGDNTINLGMKWEITPAVVFMASAGSNLPSSGEAGGTRWMTFTGFQFHY